jgi:hypothetical protein
LDGFIDVIRIISLINQIRNANKEIAFSGQLSSLTGEARVGFEFATDSLQD